MNDLLAARSQMAMSLAFHIVFAVVGIAMPLLMVLAEWRWLRLGESQDLDLAKRWSRGTAIMFAVGAVSGTVLSFELGLLWPEFMARAGPLLSMPFAMEGFAFFLEAIFLGLYLYGWDRVPRVLHWASGIGVLVCGTLSGIFVVSANAWMNQPTGFKLVDGQFVDVDPVAALFNPMWLHQALHMTIAAFAAVGFGVAGVHAYMLLREPDSSLHRRALSIALWVGGVGAVLMPLSGDLLAKRVADLQPVKFAAMEGHFETESRAPLRIGGLPDEEARKTRFALEFPALLSYLAQGDLDAVVPGLNEFPREEWPPVAVTHLAFQAMVAFGFLLVAVSGVAAFLGWSRRPLSRHRWFLRLLVACTPLGFVAIEAGWVVTEVGRQPWIIYHVLRTEDAVSPMPNLVVPFLAFTTLYGVLAVVVFVLMRQHVFQSSSARHG
jgi:cytochrome d ubiquinol oxidase subunit I